MKKITLLFVLIICTYSWQSNAQCDPSDAGTNTTTLISDFTTSGGTTTNISNLASGLSPMHYGNNFATMSVTSYSNGSFDFSTTIESGTVGSAIWVDWNGDLTFDLGEVVFNTTSYGNGPFTGTITVPAATADGDYYMRVMIDWNDSNPDDDACALASGRGEVEDYKVTVDASTAPSCLPPNALTASVTSLTEATLGWTENGSATSWDIEIVDVTAMASATGTPTNTGVMNPFSVTGLTVGNDYEFYVRADCGGSGTSTWAGPFSWSQPNLGESCATPIVATIEADCSTATPNTIDYASAADLGTTDLSCDTFGTNTGAWFEFTAPTSGGVKVTFTDTNEYALFDSCGGTEIVCNNATTSEANLTGLTPGNIYKFAVWKDSASSGTTDVCFEEISCLLPSALNTSVISTTETNISWTSGNTPAETEWEYVVQAPGTGTPVGAGTATTSNPTMLTGLTGGSNYEFYVRAKCGPTTFSDWAGPISWLQALPPANDECAGAIGLTVNADLSCGTVTAGTTSAATASSQADDVTGTPNTDVWYSFTATEANHTITLTNIVNQGGGTSTSTDMGMGVYDATLGCAALVFFDDSDPNTLDLTGLTASTTYYIRVYGWSSAIQYNNFDICVGTPPPPPANDDCANATLVDGALPYNNTQDATSATNTGGYVTVSGCGAMNDGVWYTFTPIAGGTVDIALTGVTGWDPEIAIYSGSCGTFICEANVDGFGTGVGESLAGVSVVAGTQYFVNVGYYGGTTDSSEGPFTIEISTQDTVGLSVEENVIEGFSLYPNPVNDRLQLNAIDNIKELSIYNLLGQEVIRTEPNVLDTEVDMTNLPTGMYVVKVKVGEQFGSYRIVKE